MQTLTRPTRPQVRNCYACDMYLIFIIVFSLVHFADKHWGAAAALLAACH